MQKLIFLNCIELIDAAIKANILKQNPEDKNQVLIFYTATETQPEGLYWCNIHTAAQDLLQNPEDQQILLNELKEKGIEVEFSNPWWKD